MKLGLIGSCIKLGTPIDFPCPNLEEMKEKIAQEDITVIDWTHYSTFKEILLNRFKTTQLSNLDRFFTKGLNI
ncbi:hypothetical protein [Acetohalobium arabaticum]|uniref:hypothetical protein n=1 Tax=Acetohalobium arabaticum TaxID=28187 RepID=UPI0003145186|nr:hypothetical protein [Acetohalobium arabaticum]